MRNRVILGDIHGKFDIINKYFKKHTLIDTNIFQVGDFGVGFYYNDAREVVKEDKQLKNLSDYLGKRNSHLYVVRGNHDDPKFFDGSRNEYENITFMRDYIPLTIDGTVYLPIGGAISIDKGPNPFDTRKKIGHIKKIGRRVNIDWWENEPIKFHPSILNKLRGVDVVLTHTAPDFAPPYGIGKIPPEFSNNDGKLLMSIIEERNLMSKLYDTLIMNNKPKFWFYGHFHDSNSLTFDETKFVGLDINEFHELRL